MRLTVRLQTASSVVCQSVGLCVCSVTVEIIAVSSLVFTLASLTLVSMVLTPLAFSLIVESLELGLNLAG